MYKIEPSAEGFFIYYFLSFNFLKIKSVKYFFFLSIKYLNQFQHPTLQKYLILLTITCVYMFIFDYTNMDK